MATPHARRGKSHWSLIRLSVSLPVAAQSLQTGSLEAWKDGDRGSRLKLNNAVARKKNRLDYTGLPLKGLEEENSSFRKELPYLDLYKNTLSIFSFLSVSQLHPSAVCVS